MKNIKQQIIFLYLLLACFSSFGQGENIFDDSYVHEIRLTFESNDFWTILSTNYEDNYPDIPYTLANAIIDGQIVDSIGVRQKGFASHWTETEKKSLKLDFNKFVSGKKYDGLKKINLNNGEGDPALQRDKICYGLLKDVGVPASKTAYTRVFLNDQYWGLYLLVEQVDKEYLEEKFSNPEGRLFKNIGNSYLDWLGTDPTSYQEIFELKRGESTGAWESLIHLMDVINNSSDADFHEAISEVFNVDRFLRTLAVDVATSNWDSYLEHGRNFYLYEDPVTKRYNWIPWDYNFSMGGIFSAIGVPVDPGDPANCLTITNGSCPYPATDTIFIQTIAIDNFCCNTAWDASCQVIYDDIAAGNNQGPPPSPTSIQFPVNLTGSEKILINRILAVPEFNDQYYRHFCSLLEHNFTAENIFPSIEENGDLIRTDLSNDPNYMYDIDRFEADLDQGVGTALPGLKKFISDQVTRLNSELAASFDCSESTASLARLDISINEFMASNDSTSSITDAAGEHDDWIELYNTTNDPISLTNMYLSDDIDNPKKWTFPLGTTIAKDGYLIVWADKDEGQEGLHANFKLKKSEDFIMLSSDNIVLDSVSYSEQTTNLSASRIPNGKGNFIIKEATFNLSNDGTSAVQNHNPAELSIYPNPASNRLHLEFETVPKVGSYASLYNTLGQEIIRSQTENKSIILDLPNLPSGMYFLVLTDEQMRSTTRKISIQP